MSKIKITHEFDMENPEDRQAYRQIIQAEDMANALYEIYEYCFRPSWKHGYKNDVLNDIDAKHPEFMEKLTEIWRDILNQNNINIDKLYI